MPTRRAGLTRREERLSHHQPDATPERLVGEQPADLAEAGVADRPGQPPVADHTGHVQVLHHDRAVLLDKPGGELVEAVAAKIGGAGLQPGNPPAGGLLAAPRPPSLGPARPVLPAPTGAGAAD